MNKILERLDLTIQGKTTESPNKSHTAKLLKKGTEKCAEKFGEEAIELIVASVKKKKKEIIGEAADTLYHMFVLLRSKNISINEVLTELASREGISGIEEKRKRNLE
jgi:phosphoribosyl-ATP pyrophosphohydrolase|tara:strand:- start:702 stop:1022 length:321 start_codon:yes stop_codon:yes gene_type:complete